MDSQSFPLEIPGFSELSGKGAYSAQSVYSQSDVEGIITYAAEVRSHFPITLGDGTEVHPSAVSMFWLKSTLPDTPLSSRNPTLSTLLVLRLLLGLHSPTVRTYVLLPSQYDSNLFPRATRWPVALH